jgi:hypothetical protein
MIALTIIIHFLQIKKFRKYFSKNKFLWRKIWIIKKSLKIVKMRISKLINYSTNMFEVAKVPTMVIFVPMTSLQISLIYHHYPTSKMISLALRNIVFRSFSTCHASGLQILISNYIPPVQGERTMPWVKDTWPASSSSSSPPAIPSKFPFRMLLLSVRGVHSHFVLGKSTTEIPLLSWISKSKVQQRKICGVLWWRKFFLSCCCWIAFSNFAEQFFQTSQQNLVLANSSTGLFFTRKKERKGTTRRPLPASVVGNMLEEKGSWARKR